MPPHVPKPSRIVRDKKLMQELYEIGDAERQELLAWIATLDVPAALQKTLAKGTDLELIADAWCTQCNARIKIRAPDYKGAAAFIKLLFEYKLQKPGTTNELHVTGTVTHQLGEMSDAELAREIARARAEVEAEEAEWKELPPAA